MVSLSFCSAYKAAKMPKRDILYTQLIYRGRAIKRIKGDARARAAVHSLIFNSRYYLFLNLSLVVCARNPFLCVFSLTALIFLCVCVCVCVYSPFSLSLSPNLTTCIFRNVPRRSIANIQRIWDRAERVLRR